MFIEKSIRKRSKGSIGCLCTKDTGLKLNTVDWKMNFSKKLAENQVNQNEEKNALLQRMIQEI